ncbi:MAG: YhdP family protein [Legionella sp.]|nr:YhdP family protein [Legionella sp.]
MTNQMTLLNNILKKIWIVLAITIIIAAVFSSIFRSLTPWATQYKPTVEDHLSQLIGQPVTVQSMKTGWYWFQPVLKLEHLTINPGQKKSVHLGKLLVGINLFKSLWHWRIQPGLLYIENTHLVFRKVNGHWQIDGITPDARPVESDDQKSQRLFAWFASQERLIVKQVSAHIHLKEGGLIPVSNLNISVVNHNGNYKLKGNAVLDQTNSTTFQLLGNVNFDLNHFAETNGQIYFSVKHLLPAQWQALFPKTTEQLESGKGDVDLWVDLKEGAIASVQAHVKFKRLAWHLINKKSSQLIQSFYANLKWKPDAKGWEFLADHIKLRKGNITWPENQVLIHFDKTQHSYLVYVKKIILESLMSEAINWPPLIHNILPIKPHGTLTDTQVLLKGQQLNYLLTRFDQLGWSADQTIPEVRNLSGVLNWQPKEGRLELDSENTYIKVKGYPEQNITVLNGSFDWKELNEGFRVSMDRFVLSKPDLTVTAMGMVDNLSERSVGTIRLNGEFSGKNLQQYIPYLPQKHIKPKLYLWLKNDLKRVGQASGKVTVNGLAQDFPFDNNKGEFSIVSHITEGELFINSQWQLIKNLEGYLRFNKRNLDIDLVNGDIQGVPLKQLNLRVDDIGKDKETMLIHTLINGQAQKMINFIMASPLKEKLAKLKMISIQGLLALDLNLEIPLYPENDDNLAEGTVEFNKNTITVKHPLATIPVEEVTGHLAFDQAGVTQSSLVGTALGYPLNIVIQSVKLPIPFTTVLINGEFTIESLKSRFQTPVLSVLNGIMVFKAFFKITDDPNDLDSMTINSSLRGLAINLPEPLGKKHNAEAPLELTLDFNLQKEIRIRSQYNQHLSTDLLFKQYKKTLGFHSGQVRLGNAQAVNQGKAGLEIVGSLDGFDLHQWSDVLAKFGSKTPDNSYLDKLRLIDVKLSKLHALNQQFDNIAIKARILPDKEWAFIIDQKKIAAELIYNATSNSLSGFIKYLHLATLNTNKQSSEPSATLSPAQIPNLNLRIDNLSVGDIKIGNMTLKSQSSREKFLIDYCKIDSPIYQFTVNGEWTQKDKVNRTNMHVKLHLKDLAKTLELWDITPAVDAGKGDLEFRGGWPGSLFDFSLAAVKGEMFLQFRNGRITHLSAETEEKLGLGKLLSILSLQTIPRRLKLDFSDLSQQGYSFDIFRGNFNLAKGIMSTQNSYIDGPVAYASMKGDLDLVRRLYDLNLSISPHITASLPIVATIAGGPIAGLAAWVANKIINHSMQKIIAYSYKITGPWNQPIVQQLSMVKKIIKK